MKLITEMTFDTNASVIEESVGGKKNYYIEGIFLQGDIVNGNKRRYPGNILANEVARYTNENIKTNRAIGELCHPITGPNINLDRVSHVITELKNVDMGKKKGMAFVGRAKIIDTPCGKIAKALIDEGIRLGVSSRGMGSIANIGGINEVQKDFRLATIDIVSEPSAPDAFVNGILEGKEFWFDETCNMYKLAEEAKTDLKKMSLKEIQENKVKMFEKFLKNLSSNL